jgi:bifunctional NMN adenylyltransferase/nudix hydrolase
MPTREFDLLVYIGRFQPFHKGHKHVIDIALERADRVAIIIGSHDRPRSPRNPWLSFERMAMIRACYKPQEAARLVFVPQTDHTYNLDKWLSGVETGVYTAAFQRWKPDAWKIGLIGFDKDESSFYLSHFPQWESVYYDPNRMINATDIRKYYFGEDTRMTGEQAAALLPGEVQEYLEEWASSQDFLKVSDEWAFINAYKEQWGNGPFFTADNVVTQHAHVLLIERKDNPGSGLWALPGGFVGMNERVKAAGLRELTEETSITAFPENNLDGTELQKSIVASRMFDDPQRSERGRIITQAYHRRLFGKELPKVKGRDDARRAFWQPLSNLDRRVMFEDHYDIIEAMTGVEPQNRRT